MRPIGEEMILLAVACWRCKQLLRLLSIQEIFIWKMEYFQSLR